MITIISRLIIAVTLLMSFQISSAWCKPQPIPGTFQMFNAFNTLESQYRNTNWDESKKTIRYIQTYYAKLSQELKKTVDAKTIQNFVFYLSRLNSKVNTGDQEGFESDYMKLQGLFLEIMEYYDYPIPPILIIYARYIGEAIEGLETNDFHETAEEMEEIIELWNYGSKSFKDIGVSDSNIKTFFKTIEKVEKAAKGKNVVEAQKGLQELEVFMKKYIPDSTKKLNK